MRSFRVVVLKSCLGGLTDAHFPSRKRQIVNSIAFLLYTINYIVDRLSIEIFAYGKTFFRRPDIARGELEFQA